MKRIIQNIISNNMTNNKYRRIAFFTLKLALVYTLYLLINVYLDGNTFSFLEYPWDAPVASSIFAGFVISVIFHKIIKSRRAKEQ